LQHDFREPNAVGVVALPGQVIAAMLGLPGGEAVGEGGHYATPFNGHNMTADIHFRSPAIF
jgi:hypothetical protein